MNVSTTSIMDITHKGESYDEKLLGITLDKKLSFKKHIQTFCKIASQKLQVPTSISI